MGQVPVRILDPTSNPVTVTVTGMGLNLGDDGRVSFTGAPDLVWAARADFPSAPLVVPSMGFIDVPVTVHMPTAIAPDLYYLGFVVRPVPTGSEVKVINEVGAFFTINVPGPRARSLAADLTVAGFNLGPIHIAGFVLGSQVNGQLDVHNTGQAAVQFWGENDVTSWVTSTPVQQRITKSLVPIARSRAFAVSATPGLFIDMLTLSVTVSYPPNSDTATSEIVLTKHVLVVSPWVVVVLGGLIVLLIAWRLRARRRHRRARARARARTQAPGSRLRQPA
jgi:hypothetical protein